MTSDHGREAENALEQVCFSIFGRDLVLRSPRLQEPSGEKELTDVLVLIDETAIIFQSKSINIEASDLNDTTFKRVANRHERARQQLSTTLNAHARGSDVLARTPSGIDFRVEWQHIEARIGIVTLNLPDEAYSDPEFRFQYPSAIETYRGIETHTFLARDLKQMSSELTTPADFLLYLAARQRCMQSGKFVIGNELDFLAFFKIQYPEIEKALNDPSYHIFVTPGYWEEYKEIHAEKIKDRETRFGNSVIIDNLITTLASAVEYTSNTHGISPQESTTNYLRLIGKLNKLTRMERAQIATKIIEKTERTKKNKWGYFTYISMTMDTAYLFLFMNETNRERRLNFLNYLCNQLVHQLECKELVAVASSGARTREFSIDAVVCDVAVVRSETEPDLTFQPFQSPEYQKLNEWDS